MNVSIQRPAVVISVAANLVTPRKVTAYFSVVPREPELMGGSDETPRLIAACRDCGSMYAALKRSSGKIQPIGTRNGCSSCDGTEFKLLPGFQMDLLEKIIKS